MTEDDRTPVCPEWSEGGHCVLDEGHDGSHLPMPVTYPPESMAIDAARIILIATGQVVLP